MEYRCYGNRKVSWIVAVGIDFSKRQLHDNIAKKVMHGGISCNLVIRVKNVRKGNRLTGLWKYDSVSSG